MTELARHKPPPSTYYQTSMLICLCLLPFGRHKASPMTELAPLWHTFLPYVCRELPVPRAAALANERRATPPSASHAHARFPPTYFNICHVTPPLPPLRNDQDQAPLLSTLFLCSDPTTAAGGTSSRARPRPSRALLPPSFGSSPVPNAHAALILMQRTSRGCPRI
jgi:hypothetical protein